LLTEPDGPSILEICLEIQNGNGVGIKLLLLLFLLFYFLFFTSILSIYFPFFDWNLEFGYVAFIEPRGSDNANKQQKE